MGFAERAADHSQFLVLPRRKLMSKCQQVSKSVGVRHKVFLRSQLPEKEKNSDTLVTQKDTPDRRGGRETERDRDKRTVSRD